MYSISKQFKFEAAHRLIAPYVGKCNSMHGHSFTVNLTMTSPELNACNMVEDFSALKPIGEWIKLNLDHATLVAREDVELLRWLEKEGQRTFQMPKNPTSEILAKTIYEQAKKLGFSLTSVSVSETCTASATYSPN